MTFVREIISRNDRENFNLDALIERQKNKVNAVFKYGNRVSIVSIESDPIDCMTLLIAVGLTPLIGSIIKRV